MASFRQRDTASLPSRDGDGASEATGQYHNGSHLQYASAPATADSSLVSPSWAPLRPCGAVFGLLFVAFYVAVWGGVSWHIRHQLPTPAAVTAPATAFSEGRAWPHLHALCDMGVRTTGSYANEVAAPRYLLQQLQALQRAAAQDATDSTRRWTWDVEVELSYSGGAFFMEFLSDFTSHYSNVTNIAVRLTPRVRAFAVPKDSAPPPTASDVQQHALLLSAHYDSALGSPAASDNAVNIATLLETARALVASGAAASSETPGTGTEPVPLHAVVLVFGGAEETVLQAAHGWISQHPWGRTVRAFLNLEGAGGTGRELVFQSGPRNAWLIEAYAAVAPYPHATVIAQEIFQSGIVPSDTDFRIYRDFGRVPGIDIAFVDSGAIYHTVLDTADRVVPGAMQRCGANVLATAKRLIGPETSAGDVLTQHAAQQAVTHLYFDVLGLWIVLYSTSVAKVLNVTVAFVFAGYLYRRGACSVEGVRAFGRVVGALLCAVLSSVGVGALFVAVLRAPMTSFYSQPFVVAAILYGVPAVLVLGALMRRWTRHIVVLPTGAVVVLHNATAQQQQQQQRGARNAPLFTAWYLEEQTYNATVLFWLLLLVACIATGLGSSYLVVAFLVCPSLGRLVGATLEGTRHSTNASAADADNNKTSRPVARGWVFAACHLVGSAVPCVLLTQVTYYVLVLFMPLMGRAGKEVWPDALIGALVALSALLSFLPSAALWAHVCDPDAPAAPATANASATTPARALRARSVLLLAFGAVWLWVAVQGVLPGGLRHAYAGETPKRTYFQQLTRHFYRTLPLHSLRSGTSDGDSDSALFTARASDAAPGPGAAASSPVRDDDVGGAAWPVDAVDRGLWVNSMDVNGNTPLWALPQFQAAPWSTATEVACSAAGSVYCDYPWYLPIKDKLRGGWHVRTDTTDAGAPPAAAIIDQPVYDETNALRTDTVEALNARGALLQRAPDTGAQAQLSTAFTPPRVELLRSAMRNPTTQRLYFRVTGPDHMALYINAADPKSRGAAAANGGPTQMLQLLDWSFTNAHFNHRALPPDTPESSSLYESPAAAAKARAQWARHSHNIHQPGTALADAPNNKGVHWVFFASGAGAAPRTHPHTGRLRMPTEDAFHPYRFVTTTVRAADDVDALLPLHRAAREWLFWLDVDVTPTPASASGPAPVRRLELGVAFHHLQHTTARLQAIVDALPEWVSPLAWASHYFQMSFALEPATPSA